MPHRGKKRLSRREQKARKKLRGVVLDGVGSSHKQTEQRDHNSVITFSPTIIELHEEDPSYVPTPFLTQSMTRDSASSSPTNTKKLGRWFPKATVHKTPISYSNTASSSSGSDTTNTNHNKMDHHGPNASILLFYQYVNNNWSVEHVHECLQHILQHRRHIGGRIRVAKEGINATVSSVDVLEEDNNVSTAAQRLRHFCRDLKLFDPQAFAHTDFKFVDHLTPDRHFKDCKILPVQELVFYGMNPQDAPLEAGGVHLDAKDFHLKLQEKDAVVIDVRNHYEAAIGRFDGQNDGAEYIDPMMRKSTDFVRWLDKKDTQEKLKGKQVLMFCTGGVRCERASAYLNKTLGNNIKGTFQLQGGIERYLKEFGTEGYWRGKNFVFDKREAADGSNPNGDGGVIRKHSSSSNTKTVVPDAKCCVCETPWDRYVGKRKCTTCGVPVLMCEGCMGKKTTEARCPICIAENITVRADQVQYIDNGVKTTTMLTEGKAASSVLKWGGGHGKKKFRKPCRFGTECTRPDCLFQHPNLDDKKA